MLVDMVDDVSRPRSGDAFGVLGSAEMFTLRTVGTRSADNLLGKARRVWHDDRERALAYVEHAVRLPLDEVERVAPVVLAAHTMLFSDVVDVLEAADPADSRWLDAALAVMETGAPHAQEALRNVFGAIDQDHTLYSVSPSERRRLRVAMNGGPTGPDPWDVDPARTVEYVLGIIDTCEAYAAALADDGAKE